MESARYGALTRRRLARAGGWGVSLGAPGAAALLAACGGGGGSGEVGQGAQARPARSVPLSVWARGVSDKAVFDQITPLVEGRYPHLAVTSEAVTGINDKIVVGLAGGDAADLAVVNMPFGVPMIGQNAFLKLQPMLARDKETDAELKSFAAAGAAGLPLPQRALRRAGDERIDRLLVQRGPAAPGQSDPAARDRERPGRSGTGTRRWTTPGASTGAGSRSASSSGSSSARGIQASWGNLVHSNGGRILYEDGGHDAARHRRRGRTPCSGRSTPSGSTTSAPSRRRCGRSPTAPSSPPGGWRWCGTGSSSGATSSGPRRPRACPSSSTSPRFPSPPAPGNARAGGSTPWPCPSCARRRRRTPPGSTSRSSPRPRRSS